MKLTVLGSSSSGNCYLLHNDSECLVIEAGISVKEVMEVIDFNVSMIFCVLASHKHNDHAKYIEQFEGYGVETFKPYLIENYDSPHAQIFGRFRVQVFKLEHDVPCYGFYVTHPDFGSLIYASDTEYVKYRFPNLNHMLIEANYSKQLIEDDAINREHVLKGHMSLETALECISTNDNPTLRNVVLIHLSDKNSDEALFKAKTQKITNAAVYVANKGMEIELSKKPF